MLNRRHFLSLASAAGASTLVPRSLAQTGSATATLTVSANKLASVPADFTGLSYEMPQLYNPNFFAAANRQLVKAYRQLSPSGVLRMGGNLSDVARWNGPHGDFATEKQTAAIEHGKTYWEWKLTDTTVRDHRDGAITPEAIHNLRGFLDATGWKLIYGLNFGSGSPERAADEAAVVAREIGPRLIAFQIGNESDFFGGNRFFRERPFTFENYYADYQRFVAAIRAKVPNARFGGPDTANNLSWVQQFAKAQATEPAATKAVLLSSHFYAMGPAKNPEMNAARLLSGTPGPDKQIAAVHQAVADSGMPFRMTEGNSCFGGGKPDVSDAFASALWVADYMLKLAAAGYAGVNLHGGGDGFYTPIESLDAAIATPRPLYYGMQFAQRFAGMDLLSCSLDTSANVTAYAGHSAHGTQLAIINKSDQPVRVSLASGLPKAKPAETWLLSAPDLASKTGVHFARAEQTPILAPYTAQLTSWSS